MQARLNRKHLDSVTHKVDSICAFESLKFYQLNWIRPKFVMFCTSASDAFFTDLDGGLWK